MAIDIMTFHLLTARCLSEDSTGTLQTVHSYLALAWAVMLPTSHASALLTFTHAVVSALPLLFLPAYPAFSLPTDPFEQSRFELTLNSTAKSRTAPSCVMQKQVGLEDSLSSRSKPRLR